MNDCRQIQTTEKLLGLRTHKSGKQIIISCMMTVYVDYKTIDKNISLSSNYRHVPSLKQNEDRMSAFDEGITGPELRVGSNDTIVKHRNSTKATCCTSYEACKIYG